MVKCLTFYLFCEKLGLLAIPKTWLAAWNFACSGQTISGVPTLRGFVQRFASALLLSVKVLPFCPKPLHLEEFGLVALQQFSWWGSAMICLNRDWNDDMYIYIYIIYMIYVYIHMVGINRGYVGCGEGHNLQPRPEVGRTPRAGWSCPSCGNPQDWTLGIVNQTSKNAWNFNL